jgi:hypothetical protein
MTAAEFRRLSLSFPQAGESAHMDHPDFRMGGKILPRLAIPTPVGAWLKLRQSSSTTLLQAELDVFVPAKGARGRQGCTCVRLKSAIGKTLREAIKAAMAGCGAKTFSRAI